MEAKYSFFLIAIYLGILILISESLNRFKKTDSEVTRKIFHIGSGNYILLAWWLNLPFFIIIEASIVASFISIISLYLPILPSINSIHRKSYGTLFYAISIGILTALFWNLGLQEYTVIGILVMSWGDGLAGVIGKSFGKNSYEILGIKKSWEGSFTMGLVSFIVINIMLCLSSGNSWENWLISIVVAIFATILEVFSFLGIDNLTVPLGSAILCFYLHQILV
jgi:phytol kinase